MGRSSRRRRRGGAAWRLPGLAQVRAALVLEAAAGQGLALALELEPAVVRELARELAQVAALELAAHSSHCSQRV